MEDSIAESYPPPERVLIIYAHPDDAEFFAGGTIARWAAEGAHITLCLITSGDKGSGDRNVVSHELALLREEETRAAANVLGIKECIFLRFKDGELEPTLNLRRHIVRMIRLKKPDTVLSSDPQSRWRGDRRLNHPDHWIVAGEVMSAVYPAARDHLNFPELAIDEGLEPHITQYLYLALATDPNVRIETTDHVETQLNALAEHRTQVGDDISKLRERMQHRYDKTLTRSRDHLRYADYFRLIRLG